MRTSPATSPGAATHGDTPTWRGASTVARRWPQRRTHGVRQGRAGPRHRARYRGARDHGREVRQVYAGAVGQTRARTSGSFAMDMAIWVLKEYATSPRQLRQENFHDPPPERPT